MGHIIKAMALGASTGNNLNKKEIIDYPMYYLYLTFFSSQS